MDLNQPQNWIFPNFGTCKSPISRVIRTSLLAPKSPFCSAPPFRSNSWHSNPSMWEMVRPQDRLDQIGFGCRGLGQNQKTDGGPRIRVELIRIFLPQVRRIQRGVYIYVSDTNFNHCPQCQTALKDGTFKEAVTKIVENVVQVTVVSALGMFGTITTIDNTPMNAS